MATPENSPKMNKDSAKKAIFSALELIVKGTNSVVRADCDPPVSYKLHPLSFSPIKHAGLGMKLDFCIGRIINGDDIMPDVCIDLYQNITTNILSSISNKTNSIKSALPHVRYGLLDFGVPTLKDWLNPTQKGYVTYVDFICALGNVIEQQPNKIANYLKEFILGQMNDSTKYALAIYDDKCDFSFVKSISFS